MVQTRSSTGSQTRRKVCYREIEENEDASDDEREFMVECSSRAFVKERFGPWTVRMDLSQEWELDAAAKEPLPMVRRIAAAARGNKCLSRKGFLEIVTKPKVRMNVRLGKLAGFMKMPVDVVYEISTHLEPLDLLHLSRTTTWLRTLFMSKRSTRFWKRARDSLEIPPCPHLGEPAYASLLFEDDCHICGAPNIETRRLAPMITLCKACRAANYSKGKDILKEMDLDPMDYEPHCRIFGTLIPCFTLYVDSSSRFASDITLVDANDAVFFKPDFVEMVGRYLLLLQNGDMERLNAFVRRCQELSSARHMLDVNNDNWHKNRQRAMKAIQDEISVQRRTSIVENLNKLGYSDDVFPQPEECKYTEWVEIVNAPRPLRAKTWADILPKLKRLIDENRAGVEHQAMLNRRRSRYNELGQLYLTLRAKIGLEQYSYTMPTIDDLLLFPTFKALVEDDSKESVDPKEWSIANRNIFAISMDHTLGLFASGSAETLAVMKDLLTDAEAGGSLTCARDLSEFLATVDETALTDRYTCQPSLYCLLAFSFFMVEEADLPQPLPFDASVKVAREGLKGYNSWLEEEDMPVPWDATVFKGTKRLMDVAIAFLKAMGFDWKTKMMKEITEMGFCFACARCPSVRTLMNWPSLVHHFCSKIEEMEKWDQQVRAQIDKPYKGKGKKAYCLDFINEHDLKDTSRILVHPVGTALAGFVNELGARLDAARDRDDLAPSVFPAFTRARCEICWRMNISSGYMNPTFLKRHIRQRHGKEPEARDAHI